MNRRQATKLETRKLILRTARQLFSRKGVEKCTMREIARQAGVSPASIVVHFKSKTALMDAALSQDIEKVLMGKLDSLPGERDLLTHLTHVPTALFKFYNTDRPLYRALLSRTLLEPDENNLHLAKVNENYLRFLACILADFKSENIVKPEINVDTAAVSLLSLYIGVLIVFYRTPDMTPEQATSELTEMIRQYLTGICMK